MACSTFSPASTCWMACRAGKRRRGFSATYSRAQALARDDVQRLSWEHPLLREMMGRILDGTMGNTALALLRHPAIPSGA